MFVTPAITIAYAHTEDLGILESGDLQVSAFFCETHLYKKLGNNFPSPIFFVAIIITLIIFIITLIIFIIYMRLGNMAP